MHHQFWGTNSIDRTAYAIMLTQEVLGWPQARQMPVGFSPKPSQAWLGGKANRHGIWHLAKARGFSGTYNHDTWHAVYRPYYTAHAVVLTKLSCAEGNCYRGVRSVCRPTGLVYSVQTLPSPREVHVRRNSIYVTGCTYLSCSVSSARCRL